MQITDTSIRSAKPGYLWDSSLKGFGVRTNKDSKCFVVLIGPGRRKKIGRYPLISLAQARDIARKILAEKTLGKFIPTHTAFEDARRQFLDDCKERLRPTTLRLYTHHLNRFPFGRKSVGDVQPLEILRVLNKLTPSQREHCFRITRTFFTWCHRSHLVDRHPMERMEPPPLGKARERTLSDEELKAVYQAAKTFKTNLHRLVWLLIRTGQRLGETRQLRFDWVSDRITFPGEITKNGRAHTFPITKVTQKGLQTFPRTSDYLFPAGREHVRGKPVEVMTANSNVRKKFQDECQVFNWTLHDLRRTFATNLQKLGVKLEVTEALLNHVSGSRGGLVGVYQRHNYFPQMQEALALWERKLETLLA